MTRTELLSSTSMTPIVTEAGELGPQEMVMASGTYAFLTKSPAEILLDLERGRAMWRQISAPTAWR